MSQPVPLNVLDDCIDAVGKPVPPPERNVPEVVVSQKEFVAVPLFAPNRPPTLLPSSATVEYDSVTLP
jgi:hypothetical protein